MKIKELYENIIVMLYTIILAVTTVVVVLYSRDIYAKVNNDNAKLQNIEVATSYLNVKIRQNDKSDAISVETVADLNVPALFISKNNNDVWIYKYDGSLVQEDTEKGALPKQSNYFKIADITDFDITLVNDKIEYSVSIDENYIETMAISLRSDR